VPAWIAPVLATFGTCALLAPGPYPADSTSWFNPAQHPQVVLYAHLLFPVSEADWHPPLNWIPSGEDRHYANAIWKDPEGREVAAYGLTMPARALSDYLSVEGRRYIPHTFSMTIGTKDIRPAAGQKLLPEKAGQYHADFYVDGNLEGVAFFRIVGGTAPKAEKALPGIDPLTAQHPLSGTTGAVDMLRDVIRALTKTGK
jgi:hypothetical protein